MYKLIISEELKNEIDYLHKTFNGVEWSGILGYYVSSGTLNSKGTTVLTGLGVYPMNVGTSTSTSFNHKNFPLVSKYFMERFKDKSVLFGSIHTHHTMGAFISNVDSSEIETNTSVFNNYLFLVVDTKESYVAKMGRKKVSLLSEEKFVNEFGEWDVISKNLSVNEVVTHDVSVEIENSSKISKPFLKVVDGLKSELDKVFASKYSNPNNHNIPSSVNDLYYGSNYGRVVQTSYSMNENPSSNIKSGFVASSAGKAGVRIEDTARGLLEKYNSGLLSDELLFLCYLFDVEDYIDIEDFDLMSSKSELESLIDTAIHNVLLVEESLEGYLNRVNIEYALTTVESGTGINLEGDLPRIYGKVTEKLNRIISSMYKNGDIDSKTFYKFKREIGG